MSSEYNDQNVFAKILRGEIPAKTVHEDEHTFAFYDAFPKATYHVLIIPKKAYCSFQDFSETASPAEMVSFLKLVGKVADLLGITETGYRLISNHGLNSGQEVPHFHMHMLGGESLGPLLSKSR